jgi:hypothetical protein
MLPVIQIKSIPLHSCCLLQEQVDQARHMHPCFCYVSCLMWLVVAQKPMHSNILLLLSQFSAPLDLPKQCLTLNLVE